MPIAQIEESGTVIKKNDQYGQIREASQAHIFYLGYLYSSESPSLVIFMDHQPNQFFRIFDSVRHTVDV